MRQKMSGLVRDALSASRKTELSLGTEQLTAFLLVLAERVDQLEELVLSDGDGGVVDLKQDLTQSLVRNHPCYDLDGSNALARHKAAEHIENLRAQQHAWRCPTCGVATTGPTCGGCGFRKDGPSEVPS